MFRRAGSADVDSVRRLVRAAYSKWLPVIGREPRPMTASYERAVVEHIIDLYEIGGELVGLVEVIPQATHLLVENVAVSPEHQRRGIGDVLLGHAVEIAQTLGLGELRLYTNAAFAENLAFYARRGFDEFRREPLASGGELVHMKKPLVISTGR